MVEIIRPQKPRRFPDPYISPIFGSRGPCALCRQQSDLTENHVPPASVGNDDHWLAQSYMTASTADKELYFGRLFRGGVRFRTLCRDCNSRLGGKEDKVIADLYGRVRKLVESQLRLPPIAQVCTKPNLLIKGLMAHIVSANDSGIPNTFDTEARKMFFEQQSLHLSSWNLFYWVYRGPFLFLMRDAFLSRWHPTVEVFPTQIVKIYPLAFMFTRMPRLLGLPNLFSFVRSNDEEEFEIPVQLRPWDIDPVWPIAPERNGVVFLGGSSYGLIARKD